MVKIKIKKKRKPGKRAGLTRTSIAARALELIKKKPNLTIVAIAKAHGVTPHAIYAHFPEKLPGIETEMVRIILTDVARPFQAKETWEAYLGHLFDTLLSAFQEHRNVAPILGKELSANYYLNPLLVERILIALEQVGLPQKKRAGALDLVMGSLIGMVTVECAGPPPSASPEKWLQDQSATIDTLPAGEHAQTKAMKGQLLEVAKKRSSQSHPGKAQPFADLLIAGLKAQVSTA